MKNKRIYYLDGSATTKPKRKVLENIKLYEEELYYNPSSLYGEAKKVRSKIEEVRGLVKNLIGCDEEDKIIFTSGASESNNLAIKGYINDTKTSRTKRVFTSNIEHSSILEIIKDNRIDAIRKTISVNTLGRLNIGELKEALSYNWFNYKTIVSIQMANNEIGTIQDIQKISKVVHEYGGVLHVDATQIIGHFKVDVKELGIDMLSASSHKFGGLKGSGFLYVKDGINITPLISGKQEYGLRGGTENVVGIVALGEAIKMLQYDYVKIDSLKKKRDYLIRCLRRDGISFTVNGHSDFCLPSLLSITYDNDVHSESLVYFLETSGIYISNGSACNSYENKPSHVLKAIGLSDEEASRTIRITLDDSISFTDIEKISKCIANGIKVLENC